ncbi:MAG: LPS export ABC transporter periplasmic protein LptC [Candidatus Eremiobacteraeota bacterium]|nr:LPS export ABC transporter periplasmic protein LptC [Candidatus Eremiobacteraeota bacterium]
MRQRHAALWLSLLSACNPAPPPKSTPPPPSARARPHPTRTPLVLTIRGKGSATRPVHLIQQVHNRIDYDLLASSYESKGPQGAARAVFQDARVTFRDVRGSRVSATAPQAVVDQTSNTVTLLGGVDATTSSGMTLQCRQLVYLRGTGMLHGSGDVVVTDPKGFRASGSSFDSDLSLTHMRMQ